MENRDELVISCVLGFPSKRLLKEFDKKHLRDEELSRLNRGFKERIAFLPTEDFILVKSIKDNKTKEYKIYHYSDKQTCSCTDYHIRNKSCKHLWKYRLYYKKGLLPKTDQDIREWTISSLEQDINFMRKNGSDYYIDRFKKLRTKCKNNKPIDLLFEEIHEERGLIYKEYRK